MSSARANVRPFSPLLLLALIAGIPATALPQAGSDGSCVSFLSPNRRKPITVPSCTISVNVCPVVEAIAFEAQYYLADGVTRETARLGRITRPPYKIVWHLGDIPNQVSAGANINAVAEYINGEVTTHRLEGLFLVHQPIEQPAATVSKLGRFGQESSRESITLSGGDSAVISAHARVYWDRQHLVFAVTVKDTSYHAGLPEELQRMSGCEILIDAARTPSPHPTDSVVALQVPLLGEVLQRSYKPAFTPGGGYTMLTKTAPYPHHHSVKTADGKGWKVVCLVPPELLGARVPQFVRGNIVVRVAHQGGGMSVLSWNGGNKQQYYSPYYWGKLVLRDKPLVHKPWVLFVFGFLIGLGAVFAANLLLARMHTVTGMVLTFETPEGEQKIADMVRAYIDSKVPDKETTLESVADEFSLEPGHIDKLIRKYCGRPFHVHLMHLRIEVAKERLRSSNASEATVSELCGFRSIEEMERMFLKYSGVTPYKFRLENQLT
ncbi:MAG: helix-turn-helix domain-containing protein [Chitinivibrionales bacterium]|nr:helix-turn-helix domain-containing protein [Chitinivibrionales bacterium]